MNTIKNKKNKFPEFATFTIAYNDEELIGGMLEGVQDLHNLVIISKPWYATHIKFDKTSEIAKKMGAEVILKNFKTPEEERNFGMELLEKQGYKHIFILDTDEYYLKKDILKMIKHVLLYNKDMYYSSAADRIYWKNENWYFKHGGFQIYVKSFIRFTSSRGLKNAQTCGYLPSDIVMHHFAYNKTDEKMLEKITTRDYFDKLRENWYEEKWLKWTPDTKYMHPVSPKCFKQALLVKAIPEEIIKRLHRNYLL